MSALVLAAVGVGLAGCGAVATAPPARHAVRGPRPIVIPVKMLWSVFGARPMITVRVGKGPEVPVLLDTGSTGLHIYTRGVRLGGRSGVAVTGHPDAVTYADGTTQRGVIARARLTIGHLKTARAVSFGLIDKVGCVTQIHFCPGFGGIKGFVSVGEYGILGIGLRRSPDRIENPLLALPAAYARTWSVELEETGGALTMRPDLVGRPVARFSLASDGRARRRARAWKDNRTRVCWATPDLRGAACEPTLFDSGSVTMLWYGGLLSHSDTSVTSVLVNPGEHVAAWEPGRRKAFWTFASGNEFSHDSVLALHGGRPLVIAAVQAFLKFNIAYDDIHGRIALYPQSPP